MRNDELHQKRHKVWHVKQTVDKSKGKVPDEVSTILCYLLSLEIMTMRKNPMKRYLWLSGFAKQKVQHLRSLRSIYI